MPINFRLYKHVYASVAAGIRCDVRNNDVLPPYMSSIKFTTPKTTLFRYNIEPRTIIHIPPIIVLSKIFPSIFPIEAIKTSCNIYIVTLLIIVHCPLPGSSRFFLSFIKKHHKNFLWCRCSVSRKFHCHHDGSCTSGIVSAIPL